MPEGRKVIHMDTLLLQSLLDELRATNNALFEMKQELKKIKEDTKFIAESGLSFNQRTAIASEALADRFKA